MSLTEDGECEQKVLEQLGADFGTFGLRPGLDGLQVTFVHPHLNLFRHTVGTATERKRKHMKHVFMKCKTVSDSLEKQTKMLFFTLEIENRVILGFGKRLHKKIPECSLCASPGYFYYPICLHYPTGILSVVLSTGLHSVSIRLKTAAFDRSVPPEQNHH